MSKDIFTAEVHNLEYDTYFATADMLSITESMLNLSVEDEALIGHVRLHTLANSFAVIVGNAALESFGKSVSELNDGVVRVVIAPVSNEDGYHMTVTEVYDVLGDKLASDDPSFLRVLGTFADYMMLVPQQEDVVNIR
jgi:hypothetical protein